ncbi:MAG: pentapeptide repeat-containing protein [Cyanobacteria bacterium J06649_11]
MNLYNKQIIHRHLKNAVYRLKQSQLEKRVIILNDLKNIADEYPEFYSNIIQIITEFIKRNRSFKQLNNCQQNHISEINIDIQTALKIITNPDIDEYLRRVIVDLSYIDIRGADLRGGNLKKINLQQSILYRVNFTDAILNNANLNGAVLSAANLQNANLVWANLSGAILNAANLSHANLTHTDLHCANLFLANLQGANLSGANLDGANLREAKFYRK